MANDNQGQSLGAIVKGLLVLAGIVFIGGEGVSFLVNNVGGTLLVFFDKLSSLEVTYNLLRTLTAA